MILRELGYVLQWHVIRVRFLNSLSEVMDNSSREVKKRWWSPQFKVGWFTPVNQHAVLYSIRIPPRTLYLLQKKYIFSLFWDCGLATTTLQIPQQWGNHGNCFQNTPPHSGREEWIPWALGRRPNPSAYSHILYAANGVEPMTQTGIPALTHKWITSPLLLWVNFFPLFFHFNWCSTIFSVLCGTRKKGSSLLAGSPQH